MDSKIPVLHILNGEHYSGLERVVDQLAEMAPAYGYRLHLILLKPMVMRSNMKSKQAIIFECPMRNRFDLAVSRSITGLAESTGSKLIHSHTVRSSLVAAKVKKCTALPWVCHIHSPALRDTEQLLLNVINFVAEAMVIKGADKILPVSLALAQYTKTYYNLPDQRMRVIPNGVATTTASYRNEHSKTVKTVAALGLFHPSKGIEYLILATRILLDQGHSIKVKIIGDFSDKAYERDVRLLVIREGLEELVEFVGFVTDVNKQLIRCDILAFPSLHGEGMPMAVLEAMALGLAIVASDIPGITELLEQGAGLLIPTRSPKLLADAILQLILDDKLVESLCLEAVRRQREHYSVQAMGEAVFRTYDLLLGRTREA
ncbi:MAG: glycosyltransferase family 4 protein [Nitrosomonas sp.]|uniref:glycosyltransferase family 4 protein n=1 Tax=Nitrosomonas sp. TaxID=42353 RepID=UPI002720BD91|nr:glycosyltransferase family 4 protein [Nitrosomonas sp.]MDO9311730.1 glycosyltransferase family 4 protein [Nitrosomonas sp.]MDP3184559.1 glycosyltransferase family 4 protein [Anaerolineales bacterium]MDP3609345.1 glycosyltransferase family 4 protein [Methylophilus sp.]MDZ4106382.1 glycosyltransferase family 4 protein [Nitrosomonas sp.]